MSEIRRYTITSSVISQAKNDPLSIQKFFLNLGWEPPKHLHTIPNGMQRLIFLHKVEGWLALSRKNQLFLIISPVIAYLYAKEEAPSLLWVLLLISVPIFLVGLFGLYAFQTGWFGKQLQILDKGFVVLVGDALIENLPQHRFLIVEERRLERLLVQVQHKIQHVHDVHEKLLRKSKELNEDSSRLSISMNQEKEHLRAAKEKTQELLVQIRNNLALFEQQRSHILNRAELEYIRHQARALTQEEQQQFSQRALADLEVDSISLGASIKSVEIELGKYGVYFQMENEMSR